MKVLGIDPGTARVGWGVIEENAGNVKQIAYGCVTTEKTLPPADRLKKIHTEIGTIIRTHKPDCVSVEKLFFSANATTAIAVGEARGVILLAASEAGIPVTSYAPQEIKHSLTGSGSAQKQQVGRMVRLTLRLPSIPTPDDTADALAIALTHAFSYKMKARFL